MTRGFHNRSDAGGRPPVHRWRAPALGLIAPLLLAARPPMARADTLDMPAAIHMALERNRTLAISSLSVDRRKLEVQSAKQEFDVSVKPTGDLESTDTGADLRYGLQGQKKLIWGTEITVAGEAHRFPNYLDDDWRSAVSVEARQPLFRNFGRLVQGEAITAAGERLFLERRGWEEQKAGLVVEVVRSFETIVRLRKQIVADEAAVLRMNRLYELTAVRERQGRATRVDTLRVELQRGQASARLQNHSEECYSAVRDLAELLGFPPEREFELITPPLLELDVPASEEAAQTALQSRLDYAQVLQDYRSAQRAARLSRRKLEPDLSLVARREQYGEGRGFPDSLGLGKNDWTIGIAGQTELNNSRDRTAVKMSETDLEAARQTVRLKALSITREVQQSISAYRRARTDLGIAGRNYDVAAARAELARRLFEMGRGDSFSVSDSEDAEIQAEIALLTARSDASVAGYQLLRTMGTLIEFPAELKPVPAEGVL